MEQLSIAKLLEAQFGLDLNSAFLGQTQTYLNNAHSSCRARGSVPDLGSATAVAADGANLCNACWMEIAHAAKLIK